MKKTAALLLAAVIALSSVTGCTETSNGGTDNKETEITEKETPETKTDDKNIDNKQDTEVNPEPVENENSEPEEDKKPEEEKTEKEETKEEEKKEEEKEPEPEAPKTPEETDGTVIDISKIEDEELMDIVLQAVTLSLFNGGYDSIDSGLALWEATGYFCALNNRMYEKSGITQNGLEKFQKIVRPNSGFETAPATEFELFTYEGEGDNTVYRFGLYDQLLGATLGISCAFEFGLTDAGDRVCGIMYYEDGELAGTYEYVYHLTKDGKAIESIDYPVREIAHAGTAPFSYYDLLDQNRNDVILSEYNNYKITEVTSYATYETDVALVNGYIYNMDATWFSEDDFVITYHYRGMSFSSENGHVKAYADFETLVNFADTSNETYSLLNLIPYYDYDYVESDDMTSTVVGKDGYDDSEDAYKCVLTVDNNTLAILKAEWGNSSYSSTITVEYNSDSVVVPFALDSWKEPLRTIHYVMTEHYKLGDIVTEASITVPNDWEFMPSNYEWGGVSAYMDENESVPYEYPGDGVEYTVYLSNAVG